MTSLGSTLAIKVLGRKRIDDPAIGLYSHRLGDAWLVGRSIQFRRARFWHTSFSPEDIARLSAGIDAATPSGLDYYPLIRAGERFPVNDPNLAPRVTPRPADDETFLQGLLEGIARIESAMLSRNREPRRRFPGSNLLCRRRRKKPPHSLKYGPGLSASCRNVQKNVEAAIGVARIAAGTSELSGAAHSERRFLTRSAKHASRHEC